MSGAGNYCRTDSAVPQSAAGAGPRSSTGLGEWRGWGPWGVGGGDTIGGGGGGDISQHYCIQCLRRFKLSLRLIAAEASDCFKSNNRITYLACFTTGHIVH